MACLLLTFSSGAEEEILGSRYSGPGIQEISFLTESDHIQPGSRITIGLVITPEDGHHTYWKGPGIVGVPTVIEWDLPDGFEAGPIQWPAPEKVDMVGITANGYKGSVTLLTEIKVPKDLPRGAFHLHAKVAWMLCSTTCNPGMWRSSLQFLHNPDIELESNSSVRLLFASVRKDIPKPAPESWTTSVSLPDEETVSLKISVPEIDQSWVDDLEFFCDDMQVDSNEATLITWFEKEAGEFQLQFTRPDFAPRNPELFSGVLKSSKKWPGTNSQFVEISVPWPEGTFRDE
ncbi:MAG: protein-disulfide reductase DsbD domain-containing protein [Verrucomicrobiota bacterium]